MISTTLDIYFSRLHNVRESLKRKGVDGFLVTDINNVRYLTGFSGSSGLLLITKKENFFITDFRYKGQSEEEVSGWEIVIEKSNRIKVIQDIVKKTGCKKLGFESSVEYSFYNKLAHASFDLTSYEGLVEKLRQIKDEQEIKSIRKAINRAESSFLGIKPYIREGVRENSIALKLEERLKKNGCQKIPFDIIITSGPNSAMPHAKPTERKLQKADLVIIDWGGEADGYFSDMTRTLLIEGNDVSKKKEIYQIVLKANMRAISQVLPGVKSKDIDFSARDVIKKAGYGEFFGHGTGHGVGIQVHEAPRITWTKSVVVKENMVFTIEPGIYVPGLGGVRIEDMVVVKPDGHEVLTGLPKKLEMVNF